MSICAVRDELEELELLAKIADVSGHAQNSRWWKERVKLIQEKIQDPRQGGSWL